MTTSCSSRSCPPAGALSVPGADHPTGCTGKPSLDYRFVSGTIIEGTATGKSRVKAASFTGMDVDGAFTTPSENPEDDAAIDDGAQFAGNYNAIPGTIFCAGADCSAKGGKLTGNWFFAPTSPMAWYVRNADNTAYMAETMYATFGHWLTTNLTYSRGWSLSVDFERAGIGVRRLTASGFEVVDMVVWG